MLLLRRLFSWIAAALIAAAMWWFVKNPLSFPWPQGFGFVVFLSAFAALSFKRLPWKEAAGYVLPSALTMIGLSAAMLMADSFWERTTYAALFVGLPLLVLELLYTLTSDPIRYPVNALSRVNIALAPLAIFSAAESSVGIYVFLTLPWWILVFAFCAFAALLAYATAHPTADARQRMRWTVIGFVVGFHAAILGLMMPVGMMVFGTLAAFLLAFPLRARRYAFAPVPSRAHAWTEGVMSVVIMTALLVSARWA